MLGQQAFWCASAGRARLLPPACCCPAALPCCPLPPPLLLLPSPAPLPSDRSYQRRRMYTRIALGKSSAMDVVGGETSASTGQLWVLYPMLFALQGLQVRAPEGVGARGGGGG